jgi:hypothetical protein
MIRLDVEQGSVEWVRARIGIATASRFDQIITAVKMEFSKSSEKYALQLIAEQILGAPMDGASSGFMMRGSTMEQDAVAAYELQHDADTEPGGFVLRNDRRVGCSPDRFVGDDGLLEIKCPAAETHLAYLLDAQGIGYKAQVQGQLWVCEREWIDTLSYHPVMPSALVRQGRDEKFITALDAAVSRFLAMVDDFKAKLQKHGLFEDEEFPVLTLVQGGAA